MLEGNVWFKKKEKQDPQTPQGRQSEHQKIIIN